MTLPFLASDLRAKDPDRYLLSLFAPASVRPALWALFLFHHELARTRSLVSDTNLGLIRLQWWRDEIAKIYQGGDGGKVPILSTLATAIHAQAYPQGLLQEWFDTLLYAREFDLEDVAPETFDGLRNYADFTTSPLSRLALKIIGESASEDEIRQISTNFGVFEAMRSVPYMLAERRCLLPRDFLSVQNLSPEKIIDYNHKAEILHVLELMYPFFDSYRKCDSAFLSRMQKMTFIYLDQLKKSGFDVFSLKMRTQPPFLALRLMMV